jgi:hypothetical protein
MHRNLTRKADSSVLVQPKLGAALSRVLDGAQIHEPHLLLVRLIAKAHAQIWYVRLLDVVPLRTRLPVCAAEPMLLTCVREARVQHTIARNLAAVCCRHLPHLQQHPRFSSQKFHQSPNLKYHCCPNSARATSRCKQMACCQQHAP